jgi:hypothetical protein
MREWNGRVGILAVAIGLSGCMSAPNNGQIEAGDPLGKELTFGGATDAPNLPVAVQILANANASLTNNNWITLATTTSSGSAEYHNDPAHDFPYYRWSVKATPVSNAGERVRWPLGGVLRVRIKTTFNGGDWSAAVFDEDIAQCAAKNQNLNWKALTIACQSPYGDGTLAHLLSTGTQPSLRGTPPAYLSRKGTSSDAETTQYYGATGADATLADFKTHYGFGAAGSDEISTVYYNDGDLGLGREMHCKSFVAKGGATGRACFVTNYGRAANGTPVFAGDPATVLAETVACVNGQCLGKNAPVATVAMVYAPPISALNSVKFIVFDGQGKRQNFAKLDDLDPAIQNRSVPNNCLTCHGGQYDPAANTVKGAHFLPFDVFSFKYSSDPALTQPAQADKFRKLNALVATAGPTPTITEMLNTMYAPNGPGDPNALANGDLVPPGWDDDPASRKLYGEVVRPYCRTCHAAQDPLLFPNEHIWSSKAEFVNATAALDLFVCHKGLNDMPHAKVTSDHFWNSPARAHFLTALKLPGSCEP